MENEAEDMEDLIGKVLAGEATEAEKSALDEWILLSSDNRKYYENLQIIFSKAAAVNVEVHFDADLAWKKMHGHLHPLKEKTLPPAGKSRRFDFAPLRIAAGLLVIAALGYYIWNSSRPVITHETTSLATAVADTLPDGSKTVLNRKTKLSYSYNPRIKKREVKLSGEAFFEVKHTPSAPFVITTDEVLIMDLGTAFNVMAYPESNTVEVSVEEGEVQIYTLSNPGLELRAGEKGVYDKTLKVFSKTEKIDTNVLSYKTKVFRFNNTDLGSVVALVNSIYNTHIVLSDEALNNCRLTVNFNNDKIETIIEVLSETMGLAVVKSDSTIILKGAGCVN